jgi:hypothetical protein
MEKLSAKGSFKNQMSGPMMSGLVAVLMMATAACGCKKSQPANVQTPTPPVADASQATPTMPQAPQPVSLPAIIPADPAGGADLKALNRAYIGWIVKNRQRPKSFDEYIALSGVQVPPPPTGKKYVIDKNGFINFANN